MGEAKGENEAIKCYEDFTRKEYVMNMPVDSIAIKTNTEKKQMENDLLFKLIQKDQSKTDDLYKKKAIEENFKKLLAESKKKDLITKIEQ